MQLKPIAPRETAVDACTDALRAGILRGDVAPGERLPPERALAQRLGVNRVTVRAALGRLASSGLVTARQGSGHVVRDFRRDGGPELLPDLAALGDLRALAPDLLLVRRQLARAVLERLAAVADAGGIAAIEAAVDRFAAAVAARAGAADLAAADLAVLSAILDATGSAALRLCFNPVLGVLAQLPALRDAIYADPASNLAGWRLLVAWLRAGGAGIDGLMAELARRDEATLARLAAR